MRLLLVDIPTGRMRLEKSEVDFRLTNDLRYMLLIVDSELSSITYIFFVVADSQTCYGCGIQETQKHR